MDDIMKDDRFSHIGKDPRFRQIKKNERKVKIDKRFQSMFKDKKFKVKYMVDKRGRPVKTTSSENLKKYYEISDSESEDSSKTRKKRKTDKEDYQSSVSKSLKKDGKRKKSSEMNVDMISRETHSKGNQDTEAVPIVDQLEGKEKQTGKKGRNVSQKAAGSSMEIATKNSENTGQAQNSVKCVSRSLSETEEVVEKGTGMQDDESSIAEDESNLTEEDSDQSDPLEMGENQTPVKDKNMDIARGEGLVESSSDEEETFEFKEDEFDHNWGEIDKDAPPVEEATSRLAVCNMDWDRIKATDLMVLFNSFVPAGGLIKEVSIYPSEFGLARMKSEEQSGPLELTEKPLEHTAAKDDDEVSEYQREKLRKYQLNRLKYYYAVVVCDCAQTANTIYEQCDGNEYESSSTRIDLRFIPEEMEFDQEPKDVAHTMPEASTYKPSLFANSALQQSNVKLTWDETPHDRVALTMRMYKPDEIEDINLKDYLASSSDEEDVVGEDPVVADQEDVIEESEEAQIQKYRNLLKGIKESEEKKVQKDVDMEITWEPGLSSTTKTIVKHAEKVKEKQTPWEKYLDKKKEKKKQKIDEMKQRKKERGESRAMEDDDSDDYIPEGIDMNDPYFKDELDQTEGVTKKKKLSKKKQKRREKSEEDRQGDAEMALLTMDDDDQRQHFSLKKILEQEEESTKKKGKKGRRKKGQEPTKQEDSFKIKVDDSRFGAIFENPLYNIDPSAPEFKKTKAMEALIEEKLQRRKTKGYYGHINKSGGEGSDFKSTSTIKKANMDSLSASTTSKKDIALASLVKSVKTKTKTVNEKKTKR